MRYATALLPAAVILALAAAPPAIAQTSGGGGGGSATMGGGSQAGPGDGMVPLPRRLSPGAGAPAQPGPPDTGPTATESMTGTGQMGPNGRVPMASPGPATRDGTVTGPDFPTSLDQPVPGQEAGTIGTPALRRHPTENLAEGTLTERGMVPDTRPTAPGRLPQGPAQRGAIEPADRQTGWIGQQPGAGQGRSPIMGGPNVDQPINPELRNRNPDDMMR